MTKSKYTRLSITLPTELVRWADREARRLNRSRSWVIAEALRRMGQGEGAGEPVRPAVVREPVVSPYVTVAPEMDQARERRLDLALSWSPDERFQRAQALVEIGRALRPRRRRSQIVSFDTFEEYWTWKKAARASGTALT
jgi:hypothetical protein